MTIPSWFIVVAALAFAGQCVGQELEPGAYSPAPVGMNIAISAFTYNSGDLAFDPSGPVQNGEASIGVAAFGYVRTLGIAGRSASLGFAGGYARGSLQGDLLGEHVQIHRSGLIDPRLRFAINLFGGPALLPQVFAVTPIAPVTLGASLVVSAPFGQYNSERLVNIGNNRWGFKPELGFRWSPGRWTFEFDAGVWFTTENTDFYRNQTREQAPITSTQAHIIYTFRPRCWIALDTNYYFGGRTSINGRENADKLDNSRVGLTFALPLTQQHGLKFVFSRGAFTNIGADFDSFGIAYQYVWRGR